MTKQAEGSVNFSVKSREESKSKERDSILGNPVTFRVEKLKNNLITANFRYFQLIFSKVF